MRSAIYAESTRSAVESGGAGHEGSANDDAPSRPGSAGLALSRLCCARLGRGDTAGLLICAGYSTLISGGEGKRLV